MSTLAGFQPAEHVDERAATVPDVSRRAAPAQTGQIAGDAASTVAGALPGSADTIAPAEIQALLEAHDRDAMFALCLPGMGDPHQWQPCSDMHELRPCDLEKGVVCPRGPALPVLAPRHADALCNGVNFFAWRQAVSTTLCYEPTDHVFCHACAELFGDSAAATQATLDPEAMPAAAAAFRLGRPRALMKSDIVAGLRERFQLASTRISEEAVSPAGAMEDVHFATGVNMLLIDTKMLYADSGKGGRSYRRTPRQQRALRNYVEHGMTLLLQWAAITEAGVMRRQWATISSVAVAVMQTCVSLRPRATIEASDIVIHELRWFTRDFPVAAVTHSQPSTGFRALSRWVCPNQRLGTDDAGIIDRSPRDSDVGAGETQATDCDSDVAMTPALSGDAAEPLDVSTEFRAAMTGATTGALFSMAVNEGEIMGVGLVTPGTVVQEEGKWDCDGASFSDSSEVPDAQPNSMAALMESCSDTDSSASDVCPGLQSDLGSDTWEGGDSGSTSSGEAAQDDPSVAAEVPSTGAAEVSATRPGQVRAAATRKPKSVPDVQARPAGASARTVQTRDTVLPARSSVSAPHSPGMALVVYGVLKGRTRGIHLGWPSCAKSVLKYPNNAFWKFDSVANARSALRSMKPGWDPRVVAATVVSAPDASLTGRVVRVLRGGLRVYAKLQSVRHSRANGVLWTAAGTRTKSGRFKVYMLTDSEVRAALIDGTRSTLDAADMQAADAFDDVVFFRELLQDADRAQQVYVMCGARPMDNLEMWLAKHHPMAKRSPPRRARRQRAQRGSVAPPPEPMSSRVVTLARTGVALKMRVELAVPSVAGLADAALGFWPD